MESRGSTAAPLQPEHRSGSLSHRKRRAICFAELTEDETEDRSPGTKRDGVRENGWEEYPMIRGRSPRLHRMRFVRKVRAVIRIEIRAV